MVHKNPLRSRKETTSSWIGKSKQLLCARSHVASVAIIEVGDWSDVASHCESHVLASCEEGLSGFEAAASDFGV